MPCPARKHHSRNSRRRPCVAATCRVFTCQSSHAPAVATRDFRMRQQFTNHRFTSCAARSCTRHAQGILRQSPPLQQSSASGIKSATWGRARPISTLPNLSAPPQIAASSVEQHIGPRRSSECSVLMCCNFCLPDRKSSSLPPLSPSFPRPPLYHTVDRDNYSHHGQR